MHIWKGPSSALIEVLVDLTVGFIVELNENIGKIATERVNFLQAIASVEEVSDLYIRSATSKKL